MGPVMESIIEEYVTGEWFIEPLKSSNSKTLYVHCFKGWVNDDSRTEWKMMC